MTYEFSPVRWLLSACRRDIVMTISHSKAAASSMVLVTFKTPWARVTPWVGISITLVLSSWVKEVMVSLCREWDVPTMTLEKIHIRACCLCLDNLLVGQCWENSKSKTHQSLRLYIYVIKHQHYTLDILGSPICVNARTTCKCEIIIIINVNQIQSPYNNPRDNLISSVNYSQRVILVNTQNLMIPGDLRM